MTGMKTWMLGAAMVAGAAALGTAQAQAAEFGVYVRGPVAYVPPCPGPGYVWIDGYMANGYWVPGRWNFAGERRWEHRDRFDYGRRNVDRYDHRDFDRGRGYDRGRR